MPPFVRFAILALIAAPPASAQSDVDNIGRLDAYVCEKLPSAPGIDIKLLDNAPRNVQFRDAFVARVKENGIAVTAGAPLLLLLEIKTVREFTDPQRGQLGEVRIGKGAGVDVRGKFWSNSEDSILGGRKTRSRRHSVDRLHVTASLNGRSDGRCVWQGEISYNLDGRDPDRTARNIMPILADAIGKAAQDRSVAIPE